MNKPERIEKIIDEKNSNINYIAVPSVDSDMTYEQYKINELIDGFNWLLDREDERVNINLDKPLGSRVEGKLTYASTYDQPQQDEPVVSTSKYNYDYQNGYAQGRFDEEIERIHPQHDDKSVVQDIIKPIFDESLHKIDKVIQGVDTDHPAEQEIEFIIEGEDIGCENGYPYSVTTDRRYKTKEQAESTKLYIESALKFYKHFDNAKEYINNKDGNAKYEVIDKDNYRITIERYAKNLPDTSGVEKAIDFYKKYRFDKERLSQDIMKSTMSDTAGDVTNKSENQIKERFIRWYQNHPDVKNKDEYETAHFWWVQNCVNELFDYKIDVNHWVDLQKPDTSGVEQQSDWEATIRKYERSNLKAREWLYRLQRDIPRWISQAKASEYKFEDWELKKMYKWSTIATKVEGGNLLDDALRNRIVKLISSQKEK